jgi:Transposase DDE domain group 1
MNTIAFEDGGEQEETVSAFLMLVLEYATEMGLFLLLEQMVGVKMKTVVYSVLHKAQTVIASVVLGCAHTKAINETLGEEVAAANYLGMQHWPDQSQINRYLTRFTAANVDALGVVHERVLRQESRARHACGLLVVDIDQCGLVANGQTYEFHRKGYFPRKRGAEGYQVSLAHIGAYEEAVAFYLDPGHVHCKSRLPDLLRAVDRLFGPHETAIELIRRLDAGYDSADNRATLAAAPGYVVLKGADNALAARLARDVPLQDWLPVADEVHGTEVAPDATGLRRLVYELHQADGTVEYALLYTNLPAAAWLVGPLFAFYNERTTIEAFFCQSRHVYNIQNLRSRKFHAIYAFLRFVVLTHNLLVWVKQARLARTELGTATTRQLVSRIARVRAHISWDGQWHIHILRARSSHWAALLIKALVPPPQPVQLALPFARLHKT